MKIFAAVLLGAALVASAPVNAQDRENTSKEDKSNMSDASRNDARPSMSHQVSRHVSHHRVTYSRTYKTDQEEQHQTEELNRQYRGVPRSEGN
jgi:hypothetical protein